MGKILITDDEEVIRQVFYRVLTKQGYEVETARDGLEALEKIKKSHFDMVISDLKMPNMDGMTLIKNIKRLSKPSPSFKRNITMEEGLGKDIPIIIVITGYATIQTAKEAIKLGCYDYITKPFDAEEVSIIIKRALEGRKLALEKKKLQEHLARAEKLASLGEMAAGMAHEVNTALTSIKLFVEMLLTKNIDAGEDIDNFSVILSEIERAENLTERFLNFAKPQGMEFKETDINKLIDRSLEFLKYKFDRQEVEIDTMFDSRLPEVLCDPSKMEEVFVNLFMNSIEAMPKGGKLNIKTTVSNKRVIIIVSDTGCGIRKNNLDKIFDPFFTTKPEGSGLGLSIVYRIITEHKGTISIASKKNKGTEVRIELPISKTVDSSQ
jgi:signal transduction histidine kinase